jgi:formylmethanofuran dehydrogenase subunit B
MTTKKEDRVVPNASTGKNNGMATPSAIERTEDVVCLRCGCLCDDIAVEFDRGASRIIEAHRACSIGRPWFLEHGSAAGPETTDASIDGQPCARRAAIDRAVKILQGARAPVVLGLSQTVVETVGLVAGLADRIGAAVDVGNLSDALPHLISFQRRGKVGASLGEVKNRADLIAYWGADPVTTHPRHAERHGFESKGRFVAEGRAGRLVVVIDDTRTPTADAADLFLPIPANRTFEAIACLRAILRGRTLDPSRVREATGCELTDLAALAERLRSATYGALFLGPSFGAGEGKTATLEAVSDLVRELNQDRRFVLLSLGSGGNATGAEAVFTWQTGFANAVDLGSGHPESLPGVTSARDRLRLGEADAALIVADPIADDLDAVALRHLQAIPAIVIAPAGVSYPIEPTVRIVCADPGLEATGTVARGDGVWLPLRAPQPASFSTDGTILRELLEALDRTMSSTGAES